MHAQVKDKVNLSSLFAFYRGIEGCAGSTRELESSLLGSCFVFLKLESERNMTFLLGFKMVPSLTCRVEPEAGDVRMGPAQETGLAEGGAGRVGGVTWGLRAGTQHAPDPATEAGRGEGGGGDASVTSEKLSRYLKEVYLAQMLRLL